MTAVLRPAAVLPCCGFVLGDGSLLRKGDLVEAVPETTSKRCKARKMLCRVRQLIDREDGCFIDVTRLERGPRGELYASGRFILQISGTPAMTIGVCSMRRVHPC